MSKATIPLIIQVHDLNPQQSLKYNFTAESVLNKLLKEGHLDQESLQQVLKFSVDAGLPTQIVGKLIEKGADVNHSYVGVEKLLHIAWKHVQENASHAKEIFTLLLEKGAFLNKQEQEFYSDVNPKFLEYYITIAAKYPAAAAELNPRLKY